MPPKGYAAGFSANQLWVVREWYANPEGRIPHAKLPFIQKTALASCSEEAHVAGGVAADPRHCRYDPDILLCKGRETDQCLTAPQVATLKAIYDGPKNPRTGEQIFPGFAPTTEAEPGVVGGWAGWLLGTDTTPPIAANSINMVRGWLADPDMDIRTFDFDKDYKKLAEVMHVVPAEGDLADLSALQAAGTKLMLYVGWADEIFPPEWAIDYFNRVAKLSGGVEKAQSFFRLFMVPGKLHAGEGPGGNSVGQNLSFTSPALKDDANHDIHRAMEAWAEKGKAPDQIIAVKYNQDMKPSSGVALTRPICPYPQLPVHTGGSTNVAANFKCEKGN